MGRELNYEELKHRVAELEVRERKYRSLVENTKAVAWELDLKSLQYTYMSPSIRDLTGYETDKWKDFEFWVEIVHPDDRQWAAQYCISETEKGKDHVLEYRMVTAQGKTVWIRDMVNVVLEADTPIALSGYFFDITESKLSEEALRLSEEKFVKAFNCAPLIMTISSWKGAHLIDVNDTFINVTGYSREEAVGKTSVELGIIKEEDGRKILRLLGAEGRIESLELEVMCADGTRLISQYSAEIINVQGIERMLSLGIDITEQKKMESQLRQAQKMEAIGNLAGGIAHDFNNLLAPIVGMAELLMEDLPPGDPNYESAQEIFTAAMRGAELVKQILAFSRQSDHKMVPVQIQKIIREVLKLARSTIPSDIEITYDIQNDCRMAMVDPTQIHQVAMNLITNAYHAVEKTGGTIHINLLEKDLCPGSLEETGHYRKYAELTIADTGCGMLPEVMDKIFEPYFTTKEKEKGTGLGLAVVYGIVKGHGGDLTVSSEVGKGTTFKVYFPLMEKLSEPMSPKGAAGFKPGTERILIVDDEEPIARLVKQILERLGYNVVSRINSVDALEAFRLKSTDFDLVITDMTMPYMTGDRLARELLAIRPDIPVIICTGYSERINKETADACGIKGFLMKPIVRSELAQMVREVLDEAKGTNK